jgi:hypothetical protein
MNNKILNIHYLNIFYINPKPFIVINVIYNIPGTPKK